MLKCKINVRYWLWSVVESILVSNCRYLLSSLFRTIRHYLQLFVSIWNYSICHFSLLFATIQLLFATSFHHSRLTTRIRSCILDMDDLSHTIRDYSGVFVLFATMCYSIVPDIYLQSGIVIRFDNLDQNKPLANCWTAIYRQEFLNLNDPVMGRKQKVWWSNWWFFAFCLKTIKYKSNEVHCYEIDCFSIRSSREWLASHSFPLHSLSLGPPLAGGPPLQEWSHTPIVDHTRMFWFGLIGAFLKDCALCRNPFA